MPLIINKNQYFFKNSLTPIGNNLIFSFLLLYAIKINKAITVKIVYPKNKYQLRLNNWIIIPPIAIMKL